MARIDSLKIFYEVVLARNFSTAAKKLGLTPSAVSKQIGMLEDRLDVRLLNRTTRTVNPTEAGQIYFDRARRILEELDEAESLIADMDSNPRGSLKIAAEPIFGRAILARILADFNEAYPEVRPELFLTDHSLELVKQGFDAGIHLGHLQDPSLTTTMIANHDVILCASDDYLARHGTPNKVDDLHHHHLIKISSMEFHQPRQIDDYFENMNIRRGFRVIVNDTDMAYHAAIAGIGIAPLPNYLVMPQIQRGRLVHVLPSLSTEAHPVQLVCQKNRHISIKTESFRTFVVQYFKR
ncbi:MAG TPA: LysR family transcriptional regulator [Pseudomonadales bacterium]|jgi:DNA-binding transcriptional LysR family regulator|nr:LysR family transcriptional regulator [Gammaproteobacteria bacterium]MDP6024494.1 LysR family transcriptional regulator [Pseudomonadales bacterium]MDP6316893.1 LysR family transcriptional regulator [Pseudomonadales bacterium]MDP7313854.1 LysR family transcriptional regulator [Pseudomonadales bacterium]HJP51939.1 LysR family transcriptional regulator [Pseudomonadales bacterium]|tara:strand:- start:26485 stop:27369 length:885 start_codon:yes stop_codon:yes gene_type:complete